MAAANSVVISRTHLPAAYSLFLLGIILGTLWFIDCGFLFMILAAVVLGCLIWHYAKPEDKMFILTLFIAGLLIRFLLGTILHFLGVYCQLGYTYIYPHPGVDPLIRDRYSACFVGDSSVTSLRAWWLSQIWHSNIKLSWFDNPVTVYPSAAEKHFYIYAIFYYLFGFSQLGAKVINSFFSMGAAILIYYIAKDVFNRQIARVAAIFSAFFPTIILWSITCLKEPANNFFLCLMIFSLQRLIFYKKARYLLFLIISFANIFVRYQLGVFALLASSSILFLNLLRNKFVQLLTILVVCFVILTPFGKEKIKQVNAKLSADISILIMMQKGRALASSEGLGYKFYSNDLESIASIKQIFSLPFIISTIKGQIFFLLTPFPWSISSKAQFLLCPQMILWYFLFVFALWGIAFSLRYNLKRSFQLLLFLFFITSLSAMASGNIGSAVRHRDIVLPFFFIFSAVGLVSCFPRKITSSDD